MEKSQNLKKVVCELDSKTKLPKHAGCVPENDRINGVPNFYCHDSRGNKCKYCITFENRSYCNYKS